MSIRSIAGRCVAASAWLCIVLGGATAFGQLPELQLTFGEFDHINPVWGPDLAPLCDRRGDYIAYEYVGEDGRSQLALQQFRLGGVLTPPFLLTDPASGTDNRRPQFAPSGAFVVYLKRPAESTTKVYLVNIDSATSAFPPEVPIAAGDSDHRNPRISPDGTMVAYEKKRPFESTWHICTYCLVCGEETRRTPNSTQDHGSVAWAPNSASLVYTRTKSGPGSPTDLVRYDFNPEPDLMRERALTADGSEVSYADPSWTIDSAEYGQYIVASRQTSPVAPWHLAQVDQNGTFAVEMLTGRDEADCELHNLNLSFRGASAGPENSRKLVATATRVVTGRTFIVRIMNSLLDASPSCPQIFPLSGLGAINPQWDANNTNTLYQKKVGDHWQVFILDAVF